MASVIDLSGNTIRASKVEAEVEPENIPIAADATNGITAADLQAVLEELAARVQALEDAV